MSATSPTSKNFDQCQPRDLIKVMRIGDHTVQIERRWALVGKDGLVLLLERVPHGSDRTVFKKEFESKVLCYGQNYVLAPVRSLPFSDRPLVLTESNAKQTLFVRCKLFAYEKDRPGAPPAVAPTLDVCCYNTDTGEFLPQSAFGTLVEVFEGWKLSFNSGEFEFDFQTPYPDPEPGDPIPPAPEP